MFLKGAKNGRRKHWTQGGRGEWHAMKRFISALRRKQNRTDRTKSSPPSSSVRNRRDADYYNKRGGTIEKKKARQG